MTLTEAKAKLGRMLADDKEPILGADVLEALLAECQVVDQFGNYVTDSGYEQTWDFNRAAEKGWRLKAGRVAAGYDVSVEGRSLSRSQMIDNFLQMAKEYRRLAQPQSAQMGLTRRPVVPHA